MWGHLERIGVKEDVDACILRAKCMLDGQCAEICHRNGTAIGSHWNACIGRPEQARKYPGSAGRSVTRGCICCWQRARRKRGKANQPGLRSVAPSFGLANHRAVGDLSPLTEIA